MQVEMANGVQPAEVLAEFISRHPGLTVLTGAGCSTESGIPDYRDDDGKWKHRQPMRYAAFVGNIVNRRRYWSRSFSGWQRVARAKPNRAHDAIAGLERRGYVSCVVTQNVDALHQRAGSRNVIDLHGVVHRVRCLSCNAVTPRGDFQRELRDANPSWQASVHKHAPDGDAILGQHDFSSFTVPDCAACGGILKPDVVFFGESVPKERVSRVSRQVRESAALLVVGSSLMVFSGFRFVKAASNAVKPIAILNRGTTRADNLATYRLTGNCGAILANAIELLGR